MGARIYDYPSTFPFVVDPNTLVRNYGRQIDWDRVPDTYRDDTVDYEVEVGADAAVGATSVTVAALPVTLPAGTVLDFGGVRVQYDVVVGAAGALADATTVPVDALPVDIPAGTLLDFGDKKFARLSAAAAKDAVEITVDAIPTALVDNDTAHYVVNSKKVELSAIAVAGATTLTVVALDVKVLDGDKATYRVFGHLPKRIKAGTIMAQLASGKVLPRALSGAVTAIGILESEANYDPNHPYQVGQAILVGGVLYGNLLPDRNETDLATWKTELASAGTGFVYETYADNR